MTIEPTEIKPDVLAYKLPPGEYLFVINGETVDVDDLVKTVKIPGVFGQILIARAAIRVKYS